MNEKQNFDADEVRARGAQDFRDGVAKCHNPFRHSSYRNNGIQKQAYWDAGWEQARAEQHARAKR